MLDLQKVPSRLGSFYSCVDNKLSCDPMALAGSWDPEDCSASFRYRDRAPTEHCCLSQEFQLNKAMTGPKQKKSQVMGRNGTGFVTPTS